MNALIQAEKAVLSVLFMEPGAAKLCRDHGLTANSFTDPRNRVWFQAALDLANDGKPVDLVAVWLKITDTGHDRVSGGMAYATELTDSPAHPAHLEHYVSRLKAASKWRMLEAIGSELAQTAKEHGEKTPDDVASDAMARICATTGLESITRPYGDIAIGEAAKWARIAAGEPLARGLPSGLSGLDNALQGFQDGKLYVLAGRPSDGKTTFEGQVCRHIAIHGGVPVLRITRDSAVESLARRDLVAMTDGASIHKANLGQLTPEQLEAMQAAAQTIKAAPIYVDEHTRTIEDMCLQIRFAVARNGIRFVTVDYAQIIEVASLTGRAASDERLQLKAISNRFKALSKDLRIPILLLAQLSRNAEQDRTREPEMKDLLGSGAFEQDADGIIMLFRSIRFDYDSPYFDPITKADGSWIIDQTPEGPSPRLNTARPIICDRHGPRRPVTLALKKNKDGPQGSWPVWLDAGFFTFRPAPPNHGQE